MYQKGIASIALLGAIVILILATGIGFYLGKGSSFNEKNLTKYSPIETVNPTESELKTFENDSIKLSYSPKLFNFNYEIFTNEPDVTGNYIKPTEVITLSEKNSNMNNRMIIRLNMYGIGGGCPDFPKGYKIDPITMDGKQVYKAKYINEEDRYNLNWRAGNVYLVQKEQDSWNCPNVAGLGSGKNGASWIEYQLFGIPDINSYSDSEKEFDKVVSSIQKFWK